MKIGDTYTTTVSGFTGEITDIVQRNGRTVVELNGWRYSTVDFNAGL